ncbi:MULTISPECIES: SDR family NAD(P)-dependent oxidoreductase [Paenibacillus]|uniref:SDR family NAD(P)-dependent oxidoreductase n=1 Tax=Paenibacillus TaxID=44249 RepID=UPI001F3F17CA|nr:MULTISPECIES: SDR family NAD(P)-dependent oxidoreductase [Paenibacillus]
MSFLDEYLPVSNGKSRASSWSSHDSASSGLSYVTSPIHPVYSATKAGVHMFTDALRNQLKKSGGNIHVMELVPPP